MGMAIRFSEEDVREMGRNAMGVVAIKLKEDDEVVAMDLDKRENKDLLVVSEYGFGKRTPLDNIDYKIGVELVSKLTM